MIATQQVIDLEASPAARDQARRSADMAQSLLARVNIRQWFDGLVKGACADVPGLTLSQNWLAKRLSVSSTQISLWLGGKYKGRVDTLESNAAELQRWILTSREQYPDPKALREFCETNRPPKDDLFHTLITDRVGKALRMAKLQGFMAAVVGPPGLGKSSAIEHHLRRNAQDIRIEVNEAWCKGNQGGIVSAFWQAPDFDRSGWRKSGLTKSAYILSQLKAGRNGERRLVIVDNAHNLTRKGLDWWVGFFEYTGTPVVFVGNRELDATILKVERCQTHIGLRSVADFDLEDAKDRKKWDQFVREAAEAFLTQHWGESFPETLRTLAEKVIRKTHNLRALRNVSSLARILHELGDAPDVVEAWRGAMSRQTTDFKLDL